MKQSLKTIKHAGLAALAVKVVAGTWRGRGARRHVFTGSICKYYRRPGAGQSATTACTTTLPTAFGSVNVGDGWPLRRRRVLNDPYGVFVDGYGNIYFGDYNNYSLPCDLHGLCANPQQQHCKLQTQPILSRRRWATSTRWPAAGPRLWQT